MKTVDELIAQRVAELVATTGPLPAENVRAAARIVAACIRDRGRVS